LPQSIEENNMKSMKSMSLLLAGTFGISGCWDYFEFRHDLDGGRMVRIVDVAPQANAIAGTRQKFAVMLDDSFDAPEQLQVYAKITGLDELECKLDTEPTNTIDETRDESIFRCPLDPFAIESGNRSIRYRVVDRDGRESAARSVAFVYDAEAPILEAALKKDEAGHLLIWSTVEKTDFRELTVLINGVRIFSSFAHKGEARLDSSLLAPGAKLEVRAYDPVRNMTSTAFEFGG
jgi:hypothetical protein